jgi:glycogen(starch) synthase
LGAQPSEAVAAEMRRHRVLAVPSRDETFGLSALEGLACGCRVVASDVGALRETLGDAAILVPADDPPALAEALRAALALTIPQPPIVHTDCSPAAVARRALALLQ